MKRIISITLICIGSMLHAQANTELTLFECYEKAESNFPLIQQKKLLEKSFELTSSNLSKNYWPQLQMFGQFTKQSDVTSLPISIPGINITEPDKNQYRISGEVNQPLTGIYTTLISKDLNQKSSEISIQKINVDLYRVKERVLDIYFGILQSDTRIKLAEIAIRDIESTLENLAALAKNGMTLKSNLNVLEAEKLNFEQRIIEIKARRSKLLQIMSLFIHEPLSESTKFIQPAALESSQENNRPERILFQKQRSLFDAQESMIYAKNIPQISLFYQTGYGKPALNMLQSEADDYYIGGLRFSWNLSNLYQFSNDFEQINVNRQMVQVQEDLFSFEQKINQEEEAIDLKKYTNLIASDRKILALRERIQATGKSQLEEGTITVNEYSRIVNAVDQARQNLQVHIIEQLNVMYSSQLRSGQ